ncbi:MAG: HupE/UreJ family protein [Nitrosomonadales bacterium]|nr:HupE/UreJ family protein [Nitrosomonadales bacterium]
MDRSVPGWLRMVFAAAGMMPALAFAHAGDAGGFGHGVWHPFSGLDHVCAMVAVGLWAAQMGGRALWAVPLTFVGVMLMGGVLGMSGIGLPFVEYGIAASVLMLGVLIAAAIRLPLWLGSAMVGVFALFHGFAHGVEMPGSAGALTYAFGFMLATAVLHMVGLFFGSGIQRLAGKRVIPAAGAGIALFGIYLAVV